MATATIVIWAPRYKDNVALIACSKVAAVNRITFSKAKHLEGQIFELPREVITRCPIDTNGKIRCYAVPMGVIESRKLGK